MDYLVLSGVCVMCLSMSLGLASVVLSMLLRLATGAGRSVSVPAARPR